MKTKLTDFRSRLARRQFGGFTRLLCGGFTRRQFGGHFSVIVVYYHYHTVYMANQIYI